MLSEYGVERGRKIHRLLENHVVCEPEGKLDDNPSRRTQLWSNVDKDAMVRGPLTDASWTLFYEGHE